MGRLDSAVFSVRCPRRPEKPLVLMRLSVGRGRNVQGATIVCGTVFCSLAVVAKKMEARAPCACRIHRNGGRDHIAVAPAHTGGLADTCCCHRCQLVVVSATESAIPKPVDHRNHWMCRVWIGAFVGGSFAWL